MSSVEPNYAKEVGHSNRLEDDIFCLYSFMLKKDPDKEPYQLDHDVFYYFFQNASEAVLQQKDDSFKFQEMFMNCKTIQEKMDFILNDSHFRVKIDELLEMMIAKDRRHAKCSDVASKCQKEGEVLLKAKNFGGSLAKFNEALLWTPQDNLSSSVQLSDCFANRSVALYNLKRFEETLLDIEEALKASLTIDKTSLLLVQKVECLKSLGKAAEAALFAKEAERFVAMNIKGKSQRKKVLRQIKAENGLQTTGETTPSLPLDIKLKEPNVKLYGANKSVKMGYKQEKGRTIEATRDIEEGEVVIVEEPFVSWLSPSSYSSYCHQCLNPLEGRLVPCSQCSLVRFCSTQCRDEAWGKYHRKECPHLEKLQYLFKGHMAFRSLIVGGVEEWLKLEKRARVPFDEWPKREFKHNLESVSSLSDYIDSNVFSRLLYYSVAAALFALFAEKVNLSEEKDRSAISCLFLKMFFQNKHSAYNIYDFEYKATPFKGLYISDDFFPKPVGAGLFVTSALLNHSCDPNTRRHYFGLRTVFVASRSIKAGEEVTTSYGPHVSQQSWCERQQILKTGFGFDCCCDACVNKRKPTDVWYRCPSCGGNLMVKSNDPRFEGNQCFDCDKMNQDLTLIVEESNSMSKFEEEGMDALNEGRLEDAETLLLKASTICHNICHKDCVKHIAHYLPLSNLYELKGEYISAINYRKQTLELETIRSGESSCQVLEHLAKLTVLFNTKASQGSDDREENALIRDKYQEETFKLFSRLNQMEFKVTTSMQIHIYSVLNRAHSARC